MDAVLTAMRSHASVAAVQESGCGALKNLAKNAENEVPAAEVVVEDWEGRLGMMSKWEDTKKITFSIDI